MHALSIRPLSLTLSLLLFSSIHPGGVMMGAAHAAPVRPSAQPHGLGLAALHGPRLIPRHVDLAVLSSVSTSIGTSALEKTGSAPRVHAASITADAAITLPVSADISQYNPPVADQGDTNACVAWVTAYYMRGWYARRDGDYPSGGPDGAGSFAPMYLYSQLAKGQNTPISFDDALGMLAVQGVDTRADYTQGDQDYKDAPTLSERSNAASYKIAGGAVLFQGPNQGAAARTAIEASIASGNPVGIGIPVYDNFWNADSTHYYVDGTPGTNHGNHAVFATRYDAAGLWVENQWGTDWGRQGWVELSWAFVEQNAWEAVTMRPLTTASAGTTPPASGAAATPATGGNRQREHRVQSPDRLSAHRQNAPRSAHTRKHSAMPHAHRCRRTLHSSAHGNHRTCG